MTNQNDKFKEDYKNLNPEQKEAVDTIDGPVMVVAGPGTGKTQILSLRIANILTKTDTQADGVLCLTFTNSGVEAMRERLRKTIGSTASKVNVMTFHGFGMKIIEEYYSVLDLSESPRLMDDGDSVSLCDQILENNKWEYIRPRTDASKYFSDLKSLISVLKREGLSPTDFSIEIKKEIKKLENDPDSISSRGESKGKLKKEILNKIESLNKTNEVVKFYEIYESEKKERNVFDYDDVLVNLVKIVELSSDTKAEIAEKYLYVLIDEHQDSSGIQNEFLKKVWGEVEKPNIFVVGDDRQLIYGFGGASLAYFENFKNTFGKAKLITLVNNYRSTQVILDSAHRLLESSISKEKLISHHKESHPLKLVEADYQNDEIIACALDIKERIKKGLDVNDCAILLPKNKQVRSAIKILKDMDLPVSSYGTLNLFDSFEFESLFRILKIINDPSDSISFGESFFDSLVNIPPLKAHQFIKEQNRKNLNLLNLLEEESSLSLFPEDHPVKIWINKLKSFLEISNTLDVYSLIQKISQEFLLNTAKNHEELVLRVEVIRTVLNLVTSQKEKNKKLKLSDFISFIDRLESYNINIPLAVFCADQGIKVLTMHGSKGLEFDYVWIGHMDERSFGAGRNRGFTLPENIQNKIEEQDEEVAKRKLYVAITRAKRFCILSYAKHSHTGGDLVLSSTVADLPEELFQKQTLAQTEKMILDYDPKVFVQKSEIVEKDFDIKELVKLVAGEYEKKNVSVSLLNNFFECPWKWYFRNLLQLPEPKTESLEFGNIVHGSIDQILKNQKIPTAKEVEKIIKEETLKQEVSDSLAQNFIRETTDVVVRWVKNELPLILKNEKYENEKTVEIKDDRYPELNIYGKIDLVEYLDGKKVRVTDFKTGGVKKKSEIEKLNDEGRMSDYLRQLSMYSYLLEKNPNEVEEVSESRLEFLEEENIENSFYKTTISKDKIELLIKDITDYDFLLKTGEWVNLECHFKSYGQNTVCEYCKKSKIYKR